MKVAPHRAHPHSLFENIFEIITIAHSHNLLIPWDLSDSELPSLWA